MKGFLNELTTNILPFWIEKMQDEQHGGFYGQIDGNNVLHPQANKGAILNARILWTFSAAYRVLQDEKYLQVADKAYEYIKQYFIDKTNGGVYWELDYKGNPVNTKKQTYAQGFALYGFSEYHRATQNPEALDLAKDFFYLLEKHKDHKQGGYFEAFTEDWQPIEDMRLSEKDANEKKSMNTHLHILEPYTNLLRIWDGEELRTAQRGLIEIFTQHILNPQSYHLGLFFDEGWQEKSSAISYGHDIEASWLLYEAAEVLGDVKSRAVIKSISLHIADAAAEGIDTDKGMIYERKGEHLDDEMHWWVQAEAVVGFMYAFKNSANEQYHKYAKNIWHYIQQQIVDRKEGEWYWSRKNDATINTSEDKAGFWKCPYHNARMCIEMIENFKIIDKQK